MIGYLFRNKNNTLYFCEYPHLYKNEEKGQWVVGKGCHCLQLSPYQFEDVTWEDELPTKVELLIKK